MSPFTGCRKCGMPNIRDESLRRALGLPRTQSLTYDSIRTIQRSINAALYSTYKKIELKRITETNDDTSDAYVVIGKLDESMAHSDYKIPQDADPSDNITSNGIRQATKKRKRHHQYGEAATSDSEEDSISGADGANSRKRVSEIAISNDLKTHNQLGSRTDADPRSQDGSTIVSFGRWSSRLNVPVAFLVTALRTQVKVLDAKIAKTHDTSTWSSMQWPQRALRFLPVHATLLQALYPSTSISHSETDMEISEEGPSGLNPAFFDRVNGFLAERASLLSAKSSQQSSLEAVISWLSAPQSASKAEQAGISQSVFQSISSLIKAQNQHVQSSNRAKGQPYLPLMQTVATELRKLFSELLVLERRMSSQMTAQPVGNGIITTSSGQRGESSESTEMELAPAGLLQKTAADPLELTNLFEHKKFATLLLMNLHSSASATIL